MRKSIFHDRYKEYVKCEICFSSYEICFANCNCKFDSRSKLFDKKMYVVYLHGYWYDICVGCASSKRKAMKLARVVRSLKML